MNDETIEQEIQDKGLTAPRITPADIEANIRQTYFFTAEEGAQGALAKTDPELGAEFPCISMLTFCTAFCLAIFRPISALKVWPLMGYALRSELVK